MGKTIVFASVVCLGLSLPFACLILADPIKMAQHPAKFEIVIKKRKVVGKNVHRVKQGDKVQLNWVTDEKVKLHLHGYNVEMMVLPGQPQVMELTANATGRFPITSHGFGGKLGNSHGHTALFYLEVYPQ